MPNYAFKSLPEAENGQTFEHYNFTRLLPNTPIFAGITGLTFRKCNLVNCSIPADAEVDDCLHVHIDFCSNVHPKWIAKGLAECGENCIHVVDTDEVIIDGVTVDTIYHYQDTLQ